MVTEPMSDSTVTSTCPSEGDAGVSKTMVWASITVISNSRFPKLTVTVPSNPFPLMDTDVPPEGDPKLGSISVTTKSSKGVSLVVSAVSNGTGVVFTPNSSHPTSWMDKNPKRMVTEKKRDMTSQHTVWISLY